MEIVSNYYDYNFINEYNSGINPSTIHVRNTGTSRFFQKYLAEKIYSIFIFEGIPDSWSKNYFIYNLIIRGFIAVIDTNKYGVIPQHCTLMGRDVFYQPTHVVITNPLLKPIKARIGTEAALIKMQPDYCGAYDLIAFYADNMALCAEAAQMNMINSKFAYVFASSNKNASQSFKKMFDEIMEGNPAVFVDKDLFKDDGEPAWIPFQQNVKNTFIAPEIIDALIQWDIRFNTEIGIPNANIAKASGVSAEEVQANTIETQVKAELWKEVINEGLKQANELFGLNITCKLRTEINEEKQLLLIGKEEKDA